MPMSPSSKYFGSSAGSILPAFSISATRGRTSSSANAATTSRNIVSSSERSVSADGEAVVSVGIDPDAGSLKDHFRQFVVQSERWSHTIPHPRARLSNLGHHSWNVRSRMPAGGEHVGKNNHPSRSRADTVGESFADVGIGELHVRVPDDNVPASEAL